MFEDFVDPADQEVPERSLGDYAKDLGLSAIQGTVTGANALVGLADIVTPGDLRGSLRKVGYVPERRNEYYQTLKSPAQQKSEYLASQGRGILGSAKSYFENPSALVGETVKQIPLMTAGGLLGRGAIAVAPELSGAAAMALGEGGVSAGINEAQVYDEQGGETSLSQKANSLTAGGITGLISGAGASLMNKIGLTDPDLFFAGLNKVTKKTGGSPAKNISQVTGRILGSGVGEAFQEMPQEAQEQMFLNASLGKPVMEGVKESIGQAGVISMATGGAAATLNSETYLAKKELEEAEKLDNKTDEYGFQSVDDVVKADELTKRALSRLNNISATPDFSTIDGTINDVVFPVNEEFNYTPSENGKYFADFADEKRDAMLGEELFEQSVNAQKQEASRVMKRKAQDGKYLPPGQGFEIVDNDESNKRLRREFVASPIVGHMLNDLRSGEVGQRFQKDAPGTAGDGEWDGVKSTNPDWFKNNETLKKAGKKGLFRVIDKVEQGLSLTPRQEEIFDAFVEESKKEEKNNQQYVAGVEAENIQKSGIDITGNETVSVGELNPGDKVVIEKNGIPDVVEHKGYDEDGNAILKDGKTIVADPFEQIDIIGKKESNLEDISEQVNDDLSKILTEKDVERLKNAYDGIKSNVSEDIKPYKKLYLSTINKRIAELEQAEGIKNTDKTVQKEGEESVPAGDIPGREASTDVADNTSDTLGGMNEEEKQKRQASQEAEKAVKAAAEKGIKVRFDGTQEGFGPVKSSHQFTILSGPAEGTTIEIKEIGDLENAVKSKEEEYQADLPGAETVPTSVTKAEAAKKPEKVSTAPVASAGEGGFSGTIETESKPKRIIRWALGREVSHALSFNESVLKPTVNGIKSAAAKLGITQAEARRALAVWNDPDGQRANGSGVLVEYRPLIIDDKVTKKPIKGSEKTNDTLQQNKDTDTKQERGRKKEENKAQDKSNSEETFSRKSGQPFKTERSLRIQAKRQGVDLDGYDIVDVYGGVVAKKKGIITDPAEVQKIKNSIVEGESILKTGSFGGRKYSKSKLEAVKRQVEKERAKIGQPTWEIKPKFSKKKISKDSILNTERFLDIGLKIRKNAKIYRGISDSSGTNAAKLGNGLYTTTDKKQAKKYGNVIELDHSDLPKNPIRFQNEMAFENWYNYVWGDLYGYRRPSDFEREHGSVDEFIRSIAPEIDGVQIGEGHGAFFVKFPKHEKFSKSKPQGKPANIKQELSAKIGKSRFSKLLKSGVVNIIKPEQIAELTNNNFQNGSDVEGFTVNGKVYLVDENIEQGKAYEVLLHELGAHLYLEGKFTGKRWNRIINTFKKQATRNTKTGKAIRAAMTRIPKDTAPENYNSELVAYYLSEKANQDQTLYRRILAYVKDMLVSLGVPTSIFTPDDLVVIAKAGVRGLNVKPNAAGVKYSKSFVGNLNSDAVSNKLQEWFSSEKVKQFTYFFIDRHDPARLVQKRYGEIPQDLDYLAAERARGKKTAAEVNEFNRKEVKPFLEHLAKNDLEIADAEDYAWAMHTAERNARMQRVNAMGELKKIKKLLPVKLANELQERIDKHKGDQDEYLKILESEYGKIQEYERALKQEEKSLNEREFTKKEIEKGTDKRLKERLEAKKDKLERLKRLKKSWDYRKVRFAGRTDDEANDIIKEWKKSPKYEAVEKARQMMAKMNDGKLKDLIDAGELSQGEYDAIRNSYKYYVPLYRDENGRPPVGSHTTGPLGKPIKIATGSVRPVVDIFANTVANRQSAIIRKHKALTAKRLYNLVEATEDENTWWIEDIPKQPSYDAEGNVVYYPNLQEPEDGVYVKINGELKLIKVNRHDKDMMRLIRTIKQQDVAMGPFIKALAWFTRKLASLNTSLNPEFLLTNFPRDIQTAIANLEDTEAKGMQKEILKNVFPMMKKIYKAERGDTEDALYRDFEKHGGKIGWMQSYEDVVDLAKQLQKEMLIYKDGHKTRKKLESLKNLVESANVAVENAVRLATYKVLVDSKKVSKERAASIASNLTVDFTRHGIAGPNLNALYMFANAGIQGNIRMIKALSRSKRVQNIAKSIVGFGILSHFLAVGIGGDDDDGMPYYYKLDDSLKNRNMIFMLPGGKYIRIPTPYGYALFYNLGDEIGKMAYHMMTGKEYSPLKGASRLAISFADTFNPLASGTLLQMVMPTIGDPVAMAMENKTWFGGPLMPENNQFDSKPDSQRYWRSVSPINKKIAQTLNSWTGGNEVRSGLVDVSPETLDMLVDTYGGGALRLVRDTLNLPAKAIKGEASLKDIPGLRKFTGEKSEWSDSRIYRNLKTEIETVEDEYKIAKTQKERGKIRKNKHFKYTKVLKQYEKKLRRLRKRRKTIEARGGDASRINERIIKLQKGFIKQVNS